MTTRLPTLPMASENPATIDDQLTVSPDDEGVRLDVLLAREFPSVSRVQLRREITAGNVQVDGQRAKPSYRVRGGQNVAVRVERTAGTGIIAEPIELDVLYEDDDLAAVNKPPAMVVHPAKGNWQGTLVAGLAWHFQQLSQTGGETRPGIVHRLDRDTSGVILVAKHDQAHQALASQFHDRTVRKQYLALVKGRPDRDREIVRQPIGIHPYQREKMAIRADHSTSRDAETLFEVVERYRRFALMRAFPKTGRTHQIRVHLAHLGFPVLCDRLYGGRSQITRAELDGRDPREFEEEVVLTRQALHAEQIEFDHPMSRKRMRCSAPLTADIQLALELLRTADA